MKMPWNVGFRLEVFPILFESHRKWRIDEANFFMDDTLTSSGNIFQKFLRGDHPA